MQGVEGTIVNVDDANSNHESARGLLRPAAATAHGYLWLGRTFAQHAVGLPL